MMKMAHYLKPLQKEDLIWAWKFWTRLLVIVILVSACNKRVEIPAKTREGRNTAAYQLEDRFYGGSFPGGGDKVSANDTIVTFQQFDKINGWNHSIERQLNLNFARSNFDSEYELASGSFQDRFGSIYETVQTSQSVSNFAIITYYDANRSIVSGEYNLTFFKTDSVLVNDSTWTVQVIDSINIKNGRFDLRF